VLGKQREGGYEKLFAGKETMSICIEWWGGKGEEKNAYTEEPPLKKK